MDSQEELGLPERADAGHGSSPELVPRLRDAIGALRDEIRAAKQDASRDITVEEGESLGRSLDGFDEVKIVWNSRGVIHADGSAIHLPPP